MSDLLILCHSACNVPDEAAARNAWRSDAAFMVRLLLLYIGNTWTVSLWEKIPVKYFVYFAFGIVFVEAREGNDKQEARRKHRCGLILTHPATEATEDDRVSARQRQRVELLAALI